ncbi:MAG: glycosyltransferase [Deltaproteobacteria bacterium]|nr:glycosyltransferase [Deltaproteobacteria bacterium]
MGKLIFISHSGDKTGAPIVLTRIFRWAVSVEKIDAYLVFRYHGALAEELEREFGADRIITIRRTSPRDISKFFKPFSKLMDLWLLFALFRTLKSSAVIANSLINTTSIVAGFLVKAKVIVWAHEVSGAITDPFHFRSFWIKRAHAGIGVSRQSCDFLNELGLPRSRIHLVYNGIDPGRVTLGQSPYIRKNPAESLRLGALAIWSPNKRLDLVIETGIKVAESGKYSMVFLDIGGPPDPWFPDLFKQMESRFKNRPDSLILRFLGPVDDLFQFYQNLDGVMMTSDKESLPTVVLEALTQLVPVFSFGDLPGVREILGDLALISEERTGDGLANEIIRFFNSTGPMNTLDTWRKSARERSQLFTLSRQWKAFEQVIADLR